MGVLVALALAASSVAAIARPAHEPPGHRDGAEHPGATHGNPHSVGSTSSEDATSSEEATVSETPDEAVPEVGDPSLGVGLAQGSSTSETYAAVLPATTSSSLGELDVVLRTGGSGVSDYVFAQQDANDDEDDEEEDDEESEIPGVPAAGGEGDGDDGDRGDPTLPFSGVDLRAFLSFGALLIAGGYLLTRWRRFILG